MEQICWSHIAIAIVASIIVGGFVVSFIAWPIRGKIKELLIGRSGLKLSVRSPSLQMYHVGELVGQIDRNARRKMKDETYRLRFLVDKELSMEIEDNIQTRAIMPLLLASLENHHTRELSESTAAEYFTDKVERVEAGLGIYKKYVLKGATEYYVSQWIRRLIRVTRSSCYEKIEAYKNMLSEADDEVKEILQCLIDKNERYISVINERTLRSSEREYVEISDFRIEKEDDT